MTSDAKYKIAYRLTSRASTGFTFIGNYLNRVEITDPADLRSIYILFSFNFELLLKSRVVMLSDARNEGELEDELRDLKHDLRNIGENILGDSELNEIGISKISLKSKPFKKYIVNTTAGKEIDVYDFIDVRYDFFNDENGKERLRSIKNKEQSLLKASIEEAYKILGAAKQKNIRPQ